MKQFSQYAAVGLLVAFAQEIQHYLFQYLFLSKMFKKKSSLSL
jgi:hypothetical protein